MCIQNQNVQNTIIRHIYVCYSYCVAFYQKAYKINMPTFCFFFPHILMKNNTAPEEKEASSSFGLEMYF